MNTKTVLKFAARVVSLFSEDYGRDCERECFQLPVLSMLYWRWTNNFVDRRRGNFLLEPCVPPCAAFAVYPANPANRTLAYAEWCSRAFRPPPKKTPTREHCKGYVTRYTTLYDRKTNKNITLAPGY